MSAQHPNAPSNIDPPQEQIECTGAIAEANGRTFVDYPAKGVHCDTSGSIALKDGYGEAHTRKFVGGNQYSMTITEVTAISGGFVGALLR